LVVAASPCCHPEAAQTPTDLAFASMAHKRSLRYRRQVDVGSFTPNAFGVQDDKQLGDI
jgi:hypothetical protein